MAGNVMPREENVDDMGIVRAVELLEWIDPDDMVQMKVAALSVCQLRSIDCTHAEQVNIIWVLGGHKYFAVAQWCDVRVRRNGVEEVPGCLSAVKQHRIQRKLMALEVLCKALGPRAPCRMDAIIDRIGRLRSQALDVADPEWLENLRLAAATFGLVPHEAREAGEGEWDQEPGNID